MTSFFTSKQCWVYIIISRRDDATMIENYHWLWDKIVGIDIKKQQSNKNRRIYKVNCLWASHLETAQTAQFISSTVVLSAKVKLLVQKKVCILYAYFMIFKDFFYIV